MTLQNFLTTLKSTDVLVTICDKDTNEICKIYANGIDALDDAIEAREIARWEIISSKQVSIYLKDAA